MMRQNQSKIQLSQRAGREQLSCRGYLQQFLRARRDDPRGVNDDRVRGILLTH
jgi:hypothetical protein